MINIFLTSYCNTKSNHGAFAYITETDGVINNHCKGYRNTTYNRCALLGLISMLEDLGQGADVTIYTNNRYVIDSIEKWITTWQKRKWKRNRTHKVQNRDLWIKYLALKEFYSVKFIYVKDITLSKELLSCYQQALITSKGVNLLSDTLV